MPLAEVAGEVVTELAGITEGRRVSVDGRARADSWRAIATASSRSCSTSSRTRRATPRPGGSIVIAAPRPRRTAPIRISVTDDGTGLAPEDVDRIFDRFYRADQARVRAGGAGLGLSIVRAIAEAHGGRAEASSPGPGQGTTVSVILPSMPVAGHDPGRSGTTFRKSSGIPCPFSRLTRYVEGRHACTHPATRRVRPEDPFVIQEPIQPVQEQTAVKPRSSNGLKIGLVVALCLALAVPVIIAMAASTAPSQTPLGLTAGASDAPTATGATGSAKPADKNDHATARASTWAVAAMPARADHDQVDQRLEPRARHRRRLDAHDHGREHDDDHQGWAADPAGRPEGR